jgi:DNA topoisomerase-1
MTHTQLIRALTDYEYSARLAGITYHLDNTPGIARAKHGRAWKYKNPNGTRASKKDVERIESLVIPPAWKDVWISPSARGHIQATGIDAKGRKQYLYHPKWSAMHESLKYIRLAAFATKLPALRRDIEKALNLDGLPCEKVSAAALDLIDELGIRVGNENYAKENGTFGVTTLRNKHLSLEGETITLNFVGKSHKEHELELKDRKIARILKQEKALPGVRLFQYVDSAGKRHPLTSTEVNAFIKESTGGDFTAKDFRTWIGTVYAYELLCEACTKNTKDTTDAEYAKSLRAVLKQVAEKLGNTLAVTKAHYVHATIQERFCAGELPGIRARTKRMKKIPGLSAQESEVASVLALFAKKKL